MRFIVLLIIAVPSLMAMRTLGLFRDWFILRLWAKRGAPDALKPVLHETPLPGTSLEEAIWQAFHKFRMSFLATASAACFATAATAAVIAVMGR